MTDEFIATENGNIQISEEVIVRISAISAREVEGVTGLGAGSSLGDLLSKKGASKGIKVDKSDDKTVIDVHVTVKFGVHINEVARNIQEAVKTAVETYAGLENITVNVFIDGLDPEKEEKEEKKKAEKKADDKTEE